VPQEGIQRLLKPLFCHGLSELPIASLTKEEKETGEM